MEDIRVAVARLECTMHGVFQGLDVLYDLANSIHNPEIQGIVDDVLSATHTAIDNLVKCDTQLATRKEDILSVKGK